MDWKQAFEGELDSIMSTGTLPELHYFEWVARQDLQGIEGRMQE
jgi:hypothetical protein